MLHAGHYLVVIAQIVALIAAHHRAGYLRSEVRVFACAQLNLPPSDDIVTGQAIDSNIGAAVAAGKVGGTFNIFLEVFKLLCGAFHAAFGVGDIELYHFRARNVARVGHRR